MKADIDQMAYIGAKPGARDSNSWYTPTKYTDMAREVMGEIDLDPFSSATANLRVKAERYFDTKSDAFREKWFTQAGTVFMNPPYGRKMIGPAVDLFLANLASGSILQAIVLVNNATETKWFHKLLHDATVLCILEGRISFENEDGKNVSGNTRGQVFFYFGEEVGRFENVFGRIGVVLRMRCQQLWEVRGDGVNEAVSA